MGLDKLVLQHHGAWNGIGSRSISSKVSPMALAHMMADQFVCEFLTRPETKIRNHHQRTKERYEHKIRNSGRVEASCG